jgi:hypothetical protein
VVTAGVVTAGVVEDGLVTAGVVVFWKGLLGLTPGGAAIAWLARVAKTRVVLQDTIESFDTRDFIILLI